MQHAVDENKLSNRPGQPAVASLDPAKPPVKEIAFMKFPHVVYKHPKQDFKKIVHRNARHEVVQEELVATEHLSRVVADEAELQQALKDGWKLEPYIAKAPDDPDAKLYQEEAAEAAEPSEPAPPKGKKGKKAEEPAE